MALYLGVPRERFVGLRQKHTSDVVTVIKPWTSWEESPEADALVTNQPGIALSILTADCVPVLLADQEARVIGAAHAGWKGAIGGVLSNTLDAMEKLGASRKAVHAALGPCIWKMSYEVGPEFPAPFLAESPANESFFMPSLKVGHYLFDLPGYVVSNLRKLGVASVNSSPADTCRDPDRFFSYRRATLQGTTELGRLVSAITIK
ncbi:MAG: peptidoglycan editing factor PgeF [Alphaproteobacteria bacterium]|nr:peptidoglycan editing factor PgeF [Alphaproteobacteria bacterium]